MKKILVSAILFFALVITAFGQTFEYSYPAIPNQNALSLTYFSQAGYKYCIIDKPNNQIRLYNVNHSLYLTIAIPSCGPDYYVYLLSDNLFNQNSSIEYLLHCVSYGNPAFSRVMGYDQSGNLFFYKDSASVGNQDYDQIFNSSAVYYDGVKFKLQLSRNNGSVNGSPLSYEVYDLPGSLPCISCTTFTPGAANSIGLTGKSASQAEAVFFPNPVTDQLKLKYHLPPGYKNAEIRIYDMQGKLVENYRVTDAFDELYLPSGFNNGSYLYSLIVDGNVVKTEKLILLK